MNRATDRLDAGAILAELDTRRVGRRVVVLQAIDSTNSHVLAQLAGDPVHDGTAVFAEHQTGGRGRLDRRWEAPPSAGLLGTVLLFEPAHNASAARLMMAAAVAATDAIHDATGIGASIRWPNDIYVGKRKLAGILIETRALATSAEFADRPPRRNVHIGPPVLHAAAIGIGINCAQSPTDFPADLRSQATSLHIEGWVNADRVALARALLRRMDDLFNPASPPSDAALAREWIVRSGDVGTRAALIQAGRSFGGVIEEIHPLHHIRMRLDSGGLVDLDPSTTTRDHAGIG